MLNKITIASSSVLQPSKKKKSADSFWEDYGPVCSHAAVSSGSEQDTGTWNSPTAFVFILLINQGPLCAGSPGTANLQTQGHFQEQTKHPNPLRKIRQIQETRYKPSGLFLQQVNVTCTHIHKQGWRRIILSSKRLKKPKNEMKCIGLD